MRGPEFQKILSMLAAMVGVSAAGFSMFAIDHPLFQDLLNDERGKLVFLAGIIGLTGSMVASLLVALVMRRDQLRRRARRVFIIYPRESAHEAKKMADLLRENGVEPWLDIEQVSAGEVWRDAISNALNESAMAIVLLTKHSSSSEFMKVELKAAIQNMEATDKKTSPIIPVLYQGGDVPSSLQHIHYVDMSQPDAEQFLVCSIFQAMDRVIAKSVVQGGD